MSRVPTGVGRRVDWDGLPLLVELLAVLESVALMRDETSRLLTDSGADTRRIQDGRLAVSEAVTNAALHAYEGPEPGYVRWWGAITDTDVVLVVEDDGRGPDGKSSSAGLGMGHEIIAKVSSHAQVAGALVVLAGGAGALT